MIALVTCAAARAVDTDLPLLLAELPEGVVVEWDDPDVDWSAFDRVIVRSTWDYHLRRSEFLAWVGRVDAASTLWNSPELIEWNTDKRYLADLDRAGVPVVPSVFLDGTETLERHAAAGGFDGDVVVKPTVGAAAIGVLAVRDDRSAALGHARSLLAADLVPMLQPYLVGADDRGETGLVYVGGEFSHAFRRHVVLRPSVAPDADLDLVGDERSEPCSAAPAERAVGDAAMDLLPPTAYARIDLLPGPDGPVVLEVEVTEPSLFLHLDPAAPARAAAAFRSL